MFCTAAPLAPAAILSFLAALPAQAAGSGAELARPSAVQSVQSAVKSAPSLLEPTSIDQAVNSVVDVVKVTDQLCVSPALLSAELV